MMMTGCCDACGMRFRLRKDGTMGAHFYGGPERSQRSCPGVGKLPRHARHNLTIHLERRSLPDRLRYLAGKLTDGTSPVSVALALETLAVELDPERTPR